MYAYWENYTGNAKGMARVKYFNDWHNTYHFIHVYQT